MEKITEHVYVHRDSRSTNLGIILTPQGPVLVDSPLLPDDARAWRDAVAELSAERPVYLINSDHHLGHTLGNWAFPDTPCITHRHAAFFMLEKYDATFRTRLVDSFRNSLPDVASELETLPLPRPRLGLGDDMTLHLGDFPIELMHVGGHTPGTMLVRVPSDGVLFTGDVVVEGSHPSLGDANSQQWLDALQRIHALQPRYIVPGHGALATTATIEHIAAYIRTLRATVNEYYSAGMSRKDVVSKVKALEGFPTDSEERGRAEQRLKASL
ncbi:MAG: MBL fold metallo-hydrolase, partial [Chloroflexota bacterium]